MKTKFFGLVIVTLLTVLLLSGTAFAEGEVPPAPSDQPAAVFEADPPADTPTAPVDEDPVLGKASVKEQLPAPETPVVDVPVIEEADPEEAIEESVLELQSPDELIVQLVDAEGETLDLASQESAVLLSSGDPYWQVSGQYYSSVTNPALCYPGTTVPGGTCFISSTPIQNAINLIAGDINLSPDGGLVYVDYATYAGNVTIDGNLGNTNALTGLIGVPAGSLSPTISGVMTLQNLNTGFLLQYFNVTGGVVIKDSSGQFVIENVTAPLSMTNVDASNTGGNGIKIDNHKGNITFSGVNSHRNINYGATINNVAGGTVTINSSNFDDNNEAGLAITSSGIVNLNTVTADGNQDFYGIYIDTVGAVNLAYVKANDNNNGDPLRPTTGIHVVSYMGAINVNGAVANGNSGFGLETYGRGVTIRNTIARGNDNGGLDVYLLSGAGLLENVVASDNEGNGVQVETLPANLGAVTLKNMTARNNALGGISVETFGAVTVTNSTTDDNYRDNGSDDDTGGDGLYISTKGAVTLTTIWSSGNGGNGLKVEGAEVWVGGELINLLSPTSVTLTSPLDSNFANFFAGNGRLGDSVMGGNGISIISDKTVTIRNFSAMDNFGIGLYVDGPEYTIWDPILKVYRDISKDAGATTIATTIPNWRNTADRNTIGVAVYSTGTVSLTGLNTNENSNHAVEIMTLGAITLSNVRDWGNGEGNTVSLYNEQVAGYMPVTITNLEVRETRGGWGAALEVHSKGAITINGLWLENNNSMGAALANGMSGKGNITLTNAQINNNNSIGIQAFSNGAILFTNVRVQGNSGGGAQIYNNGAPTVMPVTLTDCVFESNQGTGLEVFSKGLITLKGVESQWNQIRFGSLDDGTTIYETNQPDWGGVDEMTFLYTSGDPVTVILRSLDEWNGFQPIVELVDEWGSVIAADSNTDGDGIWTSYFSNGTLPNGEYYTIRVLYNDTFSDGFGKYSLSINDPDELNRLIPADGAVLDNTYGTTAGVVVSSTSNYPYNQFNGNNGIGLNIKTRGAVALTNIYVSDNAFGEGLYMDNPVATRAVIVQNTLVTNPASFSNNGGNGLFIRTRGAITLSNVEAFNNKLSGADLDNAICSWDGAKNLWNNCLGTGAITIKSPSGKSSWFNDNQHFGIWAVSKGAILLTNISAKNNGSDGVFLWNQKDASAATVTVNTAGAVRNEYNENARNGAYVPCDPIEGPDSADEYYWVRFNGLTVLSGGVISIQNSNVNWNQNDIGGGIVAINKNAITPKTVTLSGIETQGNFTHGIWVDSKGGITLTKVTVRDNGEYGGIHLDNALCTWDDSNKEWTNCMGTGTVTVTTLKAENNHGTGLEVFSRGLITLNGANTFNNWGQGIHLENNFPGTVAGITMTAITANDNWGSGLEAISRGAISFKVADTSNNGYFGAWLENRFNGVIAGITISNATANNNHNTGISANTNGALTMTTLNAHNNVWGKAVINSGETVQDFFNKNRDGDRWYFSTEAAGSYEFYLQANTLDDLNRKDFDPMIVLYDLYDTPIDISSTLSCVTNDHCTFTFAPGIDSQYYVIVSSANSDGFYRLSLNDSDVSDDPDQQYWVSGLNFYAGDNVTLNGNNSFNGNSLAGMFGNSGGNISAANVGAFSNGTEGISLDNKKCAWDENVAEWVCTGSGSITMTGSNIANNNGWEGLRIETRGIVSLTNMDASYNSHSDDSLDTRASVRVNAEGTGKVVTLNNITAMHNSGDGLDVRAEGTTTLNNVRAWLNGRDGANVNAGLAYSSITRNGSFIGNGRYGLYVYLGTFYNYFSILLGNELADFNIY